MGTIAAWAFFILWGGALIGALLHGKLTVAFNVAFQMYVLREFVIGKVESELGDNFFRNFLMLVGVCAQLLCSCYLEATATSSPAVDLSASLAGHHHIGIVAPATGTDEPVPPIGNGSLRAVSSHHLGGIGICATFDGTK
jgi:hypothetical protein